MKTVVFYFSTHTCPHCHDQKPAMDELRKRSDLIVLENDPAAAKEFDPQSVPTIILYKEGKAPIGFRGQQSLEVLEKHLKILED